MHILNWLSQNTAECIHIFRCFRRKQTGKFTLMKCFFSLKLYEMHKWLKMFLFCCGKCMRQNRPHAYKHKKYKHINQISKYADHCEWPATSRHTRFIYASFAHIWANALNSSNVYVYAPHTHEQSCTKQRDTRQLAHTKTEKMCRKKNQAHEKKNERTEHKSLVFFLLFCFVWLGSCVCAYDTRLYDMLMVWLPTWVFTSVKWLSKIIHIFFSSYFSLPFARIFILYMCVIIIYNSVTFSLFLHAFFSLSEMCFYVHVSVFHISFLFSLAFSSLSLSSSLCVFFGFCFQLSHFSHFRSLFLLISLLFFSCAFVAVLLKLQNFVRISFQCSLLLLLLVSFRSTSLQNK